MCLRNFFHLNPDAFKNISVAPSTAIGYKLSRLEGGNRPEVTWPNPKRLACRRRHASALEHLERHLLILFNRLRLHHKLYVRHIKRGLVVSGAGWHRPFGSYAQVTARWPARLCLLDVVVHNQLPLLRPVRKIVISRAEVVKGPQRPPDPEWRQIIVCTSVIKLGELAAELRIVQDRKCEGRGPIHAPHIPRS